MKLNYPLRSVERKTNVILRLLGNFIPFTQLRVGDSTLNVQSRLTPFHFIKNLRE